MKNRRNVDWSKHDLTIKTGDCLVHDLKIPKSSMNRVTFINTQGIMAVTGDFGNWIFCREFHPSATGGVSDGYWKEKLQIASTQEHSDFSPEETTRRINELLSEEEDLADDEKEYLDECLNVVTEGEFDYTRVAYREGKGRFEDTESVPFEKETKVWLQIVFDAFDEICRRLKEKASTNVELVSDVEFERGNG